MDEMFCKICGGAIDPEVESINGTHAGMDYCVVILNARVNHEQARAEAAETTLRTIRWHMEPHDPRMATEEDIVNLLREFAQVTEAMYEAQEKAEAAEQRVAELEAQLDAQEWRSGDEVPPAEGWYQTLNWGMYGHLYFSGGRWSRYPVPPKHWRSVGPPPSGDDSPG
jgi:hypothetical protein